MIASFGQTSIHEPHSVQISGSTTALSSSSIAPMGHSSTHTPQPSHESPTTAGMRPVNIYLFKTITVMESDEERIVRYIKKLIDERVSKDGINLLDLRKANDVASELGLDLDGIKKIFDELNRMLDKRYKGMLSETSML